MDEFPFVNDPDVSAHEVQEIRELDSALSEMGKMHLQQLASKSTDNIIATMNQLQSEGRPPHPNSTGSVVDLPPIWPHAPMITRKRFQASAGFLLTIILIVGFVFTFRILSHRSSSFPNQGNSPTATAIPDISPTIVTTVTPNISPTISATATPVISPTTSSVNHPPSVVYVHATDAAVTHFTVTGSDQNGKAATWSGNAINTTASAITENFLWKGDLTISGYDSNNSLICSGHGNVTTGAEWYAIYGPNDTPLAVFGCYT
jgi:hypothetical protein